MNMTLNKLEREVLTDSMLKIQSIQASLSEIDTTKIGDIEEIHSCLNSAGKSFRRAAHKASASRSATAREPIDVSSLRRVHWNLSTKGQYFARWAQGPISSRLALDYGQSLEVPNGQAVVDRSNLGLVRRL